MTRSDAIGKLLKYLVFQELAQTHRAARHTPEDDNNEAYRAAQVNLNNPHLEGILRNAAHVTVNEILRFIANENHISPEQVVITSLNLDALQRNNRGLGSTNLELSILIGGIEREYSFALRGSKTGKARTVRNLGLGMLFTPKYFDIPPTMANIQDEIKRIVVRYKAGEFDNQIPDLDEQDKSPALANAILEGKRLALEGLRACTMEQRVKGVETIIGTHPWVRVKYEGVPSVSIDPVPIIRPPVEVQDVARTFSIRLRWEGHYLNMRAKLAGSTAQDAPWTSVKFDATVH